MGTTAAEEMLSLEEAAELLSVSKSTLYRMIERKEVKGRKVGRQWRFSRADVRAYLERGPQAVVLSTVGVEEVDALLPSLAGASQRMGLAMPTVEPSASSETRIAAYVTHLLHLAVQNAASDIHLVPERESAVVKMRIDGVLHELARIPKAAYPAVIGQVKQVAGISIDERSLPYDGCIPFFTFEGREFDTRVHVLPIVFGESVVMRILTRSTLLDLERLDFSPDDLERLRRWINSPSGLILCTGPTGSGKTTTLYSCLQEIAGPQKNTVTVEDPVEVVLPHTQQTHVNRRAGLTFPVAVRSLLRHDPDIMLVGEIRDHDVAEITVQAALTGHLVLSTVHTDDSASTARRLVEMGVEPFLIGACLRGIVAQRLPRCICPHCKRPIDLPEAIYAHIHELAAQGGYSIPSDAQFYAGAGCEACSGFGYRGRTGVYELLEITSVVREAFLNGATADELMRVAVTDGMHTLAADGIRKAVEGITTVDEVLRVTMS